MPRIVAHCLEEVSQMLETGTPIEGGTIAEDTQRGRSAGGSAVFLNTFSWQHMSRLALLNVGGRLFDPYAVDPFLTS